MWVGLLIVTAGEVEYSSFCQAFVITRLTCFAYSQYNNFQTALFRTNEGLPDTEDLCFWNTCHDNCLRKGNGKVSRGLLHRSVIAGENIIGCRP